jgi:hypothetical protein
MLTFLAAGTIMVEEVVAELPLTLPDVAPQSPVHESDLIVSSNYVNPIVHTIEYGLQPVAFSSDPMVELVLPAFLGTRHGMHLVGLLASPDRIS